jgi:ubiquitin carboxyl-terminal hydrolase 4/11
MNAALQCLVNLKPMHEYFCRDKLYLRQLNLTSALGHQGDLVVAFANLMQQMWDAKQVLVPRGFKATLGKLRAEFAGDDQQDALELLNFIVDGLHEEVNLRRAKPYIVNPESGGREMMELGLETFNNSLRRDWSFIFFLFYGQMKSTLSCPECARESTTYEGFSSVPLSLPEPSELLLNVIVHRLPMRVKSLLQPARKTDGSGDDDETLGRNYSALTNDQPIHICLRVDKRLTVQELKQRIVDVPEVNIVPASW